MYNIKCISRAINILPSYLRRSVKESPRKKAKLVKAWDRDIVCLPQSRRNKTTKGGNFMYPRGKYRCQLASLGLIGKVHLISTMSAEEVTAEICTVFKDQMNNNLQFPFAYLQSTGGGSKSLTIPSQSASFIWTPQQVARLSGQSGTIYILAQSELNVKWDEIKEVCNIIIIDFQAA